MEQRQIFLRDILSVLFKRKLLIAFFAIAVVVVVFIGNQVWPSTYESEASVRILRGRETTQLQPTATQLSGGMAVVQMGREDINSEIELITSNDVLATVVKMANLEGSTGIRKVIIGFLRATGLKSSATGIATDLDGEQVSQEAVDDLRESITVEAVKDSFVLDITVQRGDAQEAQQICAALVEAYKRKHLLVFSAPESKPFFDDQIERIEIELSTAQNNLNNKRKDSKIISVTAEKELLLEQYRDAQKLLVQLSESERAVTSTDPATASDESLIASLSSQTESPVVTELQLKLLELVLRRNNISRSLGPKHPEILAVNEEIDAAQERLSAAIASTRQTTEAKVAEIETRLASLSEAEAELDRLESTVTVLKDNLEFYKTKAEESQVADAMALQNISSIAIVSTPQVPADPISPNKLLNLIIGILAGIIGGVGIAFFLEYLDHGIKTPEDVEHFLHVPALASFFKGGKGALDERETDRLATLIQTIAPGGTEVVQVSGSVTGESSDQVARALAEALSDNPRGRTLLVDLTQTTGTGFLDVVLGEASLDSVITNGQGSLATVGAGSRKDIPVYLWTSERMAQTMQQLRGDYSTIVFHTAPVLSSHDPISLARMTDGAVIVVKADATRREVVARAINGIQNAGGKVLGTVLVDRKQVIPSAIYKRI